MPTISRDGVERGEFVVIASNRRIPRDEAEEYPPDLPDADPMPLATLEPEPEASFPLSPLPLRLPLSARMRIWSGTGYVSESKRSMGPGLSSADDKRAKACCIGRNNLPLEAEPDPDPELTLPRSFPLILPSPELLLFAIIWRASL